MGTGGRSQVQVRSQVRAQVRAQVATGVGLPLRRYSVPEVVMRRCSLRSDLSASSDSSRSQSPDRCPNKKAKGRTSVRVLTRTTKGVYVVRSTQCSTASSLRSDWTCSSCQQRVVMDSSPSSSPATERLCIHCGARAANSKPCTPREVLEARTTAAVKHTTEAGVEDRVSHQQEVSKATSAATQTRAADFGDAPPEKGKPAATTEVASGVSVRATDNSDVTRVSVTTRDRGTEQSKRDVSVKNKLSTVAEEDVKATTRIKLKDVVDEPVLPQQAGYSRLNAVSPELISGSEDASTPFQLSLAEGSSSTSSPSPTPTPSPTTFRSRRPSSGRLSTPESLRSGPITEAISAELNSSSSSTSPDRSVHFTLSPAPSRTPDSEPSTPQRARRPHYGSHMSESRTPTPFGEDYEDQEWQHAAAKKFDDKVHVVSETSSFIILDELNHDEDSEPSSGMHSGRTVKYGRAQRTRHQKWTRTKSGVSFEVLDDDDPESHPCDACRRGDQADSKGPRRESMERDSLQGSAPDMFGLDEEGNVLFCESGVDSRRPSKVSLPDAPAAQRRGCSVPAPKSSSTKAAATNTSPPRDQNGNCDMRNNACHGQSAATNGYRGTTRSDHHSEEQTYFCGVKEVYSVTTEKVEKWGGESREWLEKTTSHRIQHQHPHGRVHDEAERQFNLSNRINVANNNPILIASEILEIPPDQRIGPGAFGQARGRPTAHQDFSLPSINGHDSCGTVRLNQAAGDRSNANRDLVEQIPAPVPDTAPHTDSAHVRFIEDEFDWHNGQGPGGERARRIVADLVGSEPAEVQVVVPRYPALPRSRSMVVNTSSGEDEDSGSECLSCADSLESEHSPRPAVKYDDKPVRGHVVLPERPARRVCIQSPKSFFVSLSEGQTEDDDEVPVSARLPDHLRDKLIERHTMVKLQMAQNRRFLRTSLDTSTRRRGASRRIRVGVSRREPAREVTGEGTKVSVTVEQRGEQGVSDPAGPPSPIRETRAAQTNPVKKDKARTRESRARPKRDVAPVVRVHKCHVEDHVKTTFKAKPYKGSRVGESSTNTNTHEKHDTENTTVKSGRSKTQSKHSRNDVENRVPIQEQKSGIQKAHKSALHKISESKEKSRKSHEVARTATTKEKVHQRDQSSNKAKVEATTNMKSELKSSKIRESKGKDRVSAHQRHSRALTVAQKNSSNVASERVAESSEKIMSDLARVAHTDKDGKDHESEEHNLRVTQAKIKHSTDGATSKTRVVVVAEESGGASRTRATQISTDDFGVAAQTQTTPRVGAASVDTTTRAATELRSVARQEGRPPTESDDTALAQRTEEHRDDAPRTTVRTSVRTTLQTQDSDAESKTVSTVGDANHQHLLQNLIQLGASIENAEIRQKVVEVETTIQKNVVHRNVVETESKVTRSTECEDVAKPAPSSSGSQTVACRPGARTPTRGLPNATTSSGSPTPRRAGPGQRFLQRFEVIPEESRNGSEESTRTDIDSRVNGSVDSHSSCKARAALHQRAEDTDIVSLSKGWINFYLMKENGEIEEGTAEEAMPAERMEYSMEIRQLPEAAPVAVPVAAPSVGRGPVSKATSPLTVPAMTVHTATSPIPSARLRSVDVSVATADGGASTDRSHRAPPAPKPPALKQVASKATPSYRAQGVGTTDLEDASTNTNTTPSLGADSSRSPRTCRRDAASGVPVHAATNTICGPVLPQRPQDASTSTMCGPVLPQRLSGNASTSTRCCPALPRRPLDAPSSTCDHKLPQRLTCASSSTTCGPVPPQRHSDVSTLCGHTSPQRPLEASSSTVHGPLDAATSTLCGPVLVPHSARSTEAFTLTRSGVAACAHHSTTMLSMSSCRRTVVTRSDRRSIAHVRDISDAMSSSSDSTEYAAPPRGARSPTDGDSTSPCWRPAHRVGAGAGARRALRGRQPGPLGLYQHQVPPRAQPAGPPPRDGVGWTVTVAGAGANQQGDLEMRLSFPSEDNKEKGAGADKAEGSKKSIRSQPTNMSAPPGRWSLTIRNQLPGDGETPQGLSFSMAPEPPQENRTADKKQRPGRAATSDKARRPLSLIWPRLHQEINSVAAHEVSEAETILSVTGSAIPRRSRHLGHRR